MPVLSSWARYHRSEVLNGRKNPASMRLASNTSRALPWTLIVSMNARPPERRAAKKVLAAAVMAEGDRPWKARQLITTSKTPVGGPVVKSCSATSKQPYFSMGGLLLTNDDQSSNMISGASSANLRCTRTATGEKSVASTVLPTYA